ncbi:hypothetical protein [Hazenella coriacea]|uniref:hypothetical protein n=1 Tax=Hazenella coriacea TaxID=1179467 RepID=UPI001404A1F8|nr:hypothetical protein [Hazenella coriacea]
MKMNEVFDKIIFITDNGENTDILKRQDGDLKRNLICTESKIHRLRDFAMIILVNPIPQAADTYQIGIFRYQSEINLH